MPNTPSKSAEHPKQQGIQESEKRLLLNSPFWDPQSIVVQGFQPFA